LRSLPRVSALTDAALSNAAFAGAALTGAAHGAANASRDALDRITISQAWAALSALPLGKEAFAKLIKLKIPYTGSIGARVEELRDGYARTTLRDRRAVRNHLDSIHALALANLGEMTSGIALYHAIDGRASGIVTEIRSVYLKKARGTLTATCEAAIAPITDKRTEVVEGVIRDREGDVVCRVFVTWQLRPN